MFGCCRRGINLLFVAVNQISTDRFKLIASVSWSQKERVLQAPISFYSPSDILINDIRMHTHAHTQACAHTYTHTHTHTQTHTQTHCESLCSFFVFFRFFSKVLLAHLQRTLNQCLHSQWWHYLHNMQLLMLPTYRIYTWHNVIYLIENVFPFNYDTSII